MDTTPSELLVEFLRTSRGTAPVEARIEYDGAECFADGMPTFRRGKFLDVAEVHGTVAASSEADIFTVNFTEGLESDAVAVLAVTTWGGAAPRCDGDASMTDNLLVVSGYFSPEPSRTEVYEALAKQADDTGLVAWDEARLALELE